MAEDFTTRISENLRLITVRAPLTDNDLRHILEAAEWMERQQATIHANTQSLIRAGARIRALEDQFGVERVSTVITAADQAGGEV